LRLAVSDVSKITVQVAEIAVVSVCCIGLIRVL